MTFGTRFLTLAALAVCALDPATAWAQGFAIGPRLTFIRGSEGAPDGTQRFSGGFIRLGGGHTALEIAVDYRSGVSGNLTERIKDYPIQASLLVFPVRSRVAPYLLGGVGWYTQNVERLGTGGTVVVDQAVTRKMGYHGGFGAELRLHRNVGVYGDYRYTFIRFGNQDDAVAGGAEPFPGWVPFAERLELTHKGSMFTWGASFYF